MGSAAIIASPKNIVVVANDYTTLYNFRLELLDALVERGHRVTLAMPHDERNDAFKQHGCQVLDIPLNRFGTNPVADFQTMLAIKGLVDRVRPDIVLTYTAKPNIYGGMACSLARVPYVCNVTGLGANLQSKNLVGSLMLGLQRVGLKNAERVFFQNSSNRAFFQAQGIAVGNAQCLPGSGVNMEQNALEPMPGNFPLKFITIARVRQDKGYDELFWAIRQLAAEGIPAEFHVVGWYEDEAYKPIVDEMIGEYGVVFHGSMPHEEIHGLVASCDCLIHPSHHEGMSNVVLEAAAAGRPCIVSDIPGCREGVDQGVTGLTFEVKNARSLLGAICDMIALAPEERAAMGKAAHEKMARDFDRRFVVEEYLKLIESA